MLLNAINLHKHFSTGKDKIQILTGVNLQLQAGKSVAIVGESGSGKSTLLGLLAGLDLPQQGQIQINGTEITSLDEDQRAQLRARTAGFVFQSFYLMEDLTAAENVALPLELFGHRNPQKTAQTWLEKLGLSNRSKHFPKQLSGGEQQRVALCRAFAVRPALLFADEPTANLDQTTAKQVIQQLFDLHKQSNNSMVLVTHDSKLAQRCDRVYHLTNGQLHAK